MTFLLVENSVEIKIEIIMNFMNDIINPPCKSLLAMFFELSLEACQKRVSSCLKSLVRPKRTLNQLFELLIIDVKQLIVSPSHVDVPEEKVAGERSKESPVGGPDGPIEVGGVC